MSTTRSNTAPTLETAAAIEAVKADASREAHAAAEPSPQLPAEPLVTITPPRSWLNFGLGELWAHRELLYFLAWRDLKVRYKQAVLGIAWVLIQPLMLTLIFTVFLGMLARVPSDGVPYPLLIYVGLLPWTFFSSSVNTSGNSLVANSNLITKVYFPRLIVPSASVLARLVDFGIAFLILAGMMIFYRVPLNVKLLALPALVTLTTLLALGFGMLISALNVKYRDVGIMLPVLLQLWMYVSPVLYSTSLVPGNWRWLYSLNPLVGIIDGFRSAVLGRPFDLPSLAVSAVFTTALLLFALYFFRRVERSFADVI
jgi:lipopolysaccharide transport system permease protein